MQDDKSRNFYNTISKDLKIKKTILILYTVTLVKKIAFVNVTVKLIFLYIV